MATIIAKIAPYPDESLHSLLTRVIRENVYDRVAWLREACGIPFSYQDLWSPEQCDALASLLGLPETAVRRRAYVPDGDGFAFFTHRLTRKQFEWARRKVCPCCLDEFGYHSAVFELSAIQVCPLHATRLRTVCHACGKRLRWSIPEVAACSNCHADLRRAPFEAVAIEDLGGVAAIAGLAGFPRSHPAIDPAAVTIPSGLAHLGLGELQTLVVRLGLFLRSGRRSWQGHALNDPLAAHSVVDAAWTVLRDWPHSFYSLLREVSELKDDIRRPTAGVRRAFKSLYDYPIRQHGEPWLTLQSGLRDFAAHHWGGNVVPRSNAKLPVRSHLISQTEVEKVIGVAKTRALIGSGLVYAEIVRPRSGAGKTSTLFLDRAALRHYCPAGVAPLDLKATSRRLGLSQALTKRIVESGALLPLDGPSIGESKRWLFAVPEIDRLIAQFASRLDRDADITGPTVAFAPLLKAQLERGLPLTELLAAIRSGDLPAVARSETIVGLAAFHFDRRAVQTTVRDIASRCSAFTEVSRADVIAELACRKDTVAWLITNGYLEEVPGFGRQRPITRASLQTFQARWTKAGEVAARVRSSRMLVSRALIAAGVTCTTPVSDKITVFFDRRETAAVDIEGWLDEVALHRGKTSREYETSLAKRNGAKTYGERSNEQPVGSTPMREHRLINIR